MKWFNLFNSGRQKLSFVIGILVLVFIASCRTTPKLKDQDPMTSKTGADTLNHSKDTEVDTLHFKTLAISDSVKAFDQQQHSPTAKIDLSFVMATNQNNQAQYINRELKKILATVPENNKGDFNEIAHTKMQRYLTDYKNDMTDVLEDSPDMKDDKGNYATSMNYLSDEYLSVVFNAHDYVNIQEDTYEYTGGAHGNYGSFFKCFDVAKQMQLALKDILSIDSVILQPIVEKYFREQNDLKADEALNTILFDEHLPANDNFYFNDKGIKFIYNPYEVAAYAVGKIEVFVPYTAVNSYLNQDFAKRIGLPNQ